jgi:hypothetical protein
LIYGLDLLSLCPLEDNKFRLEGGFSVCSPSFCEEREKMNKEYYRDKIIEYIMRISSEKALRYLYLITKSIAKDT